MKKYFIILIISGICNSVFGQGICDYNTISELRSKYTQQKIFRYDNPPAPPPITPKKKKQKYGRFSYVPDSLLIRLYPFNNDSIQVIVPDSCCDDFPRIGQKYDDKYRYIGSMDRNKMGFFLDNLYNYWYKDEGYGISYSISITQRNRPDVVLVFGNRETENYLAIFFDDNSVRFEYNFDGIVEDTLYLGDYCPGLANRLKCFFHEYFNYDGKHQY